MIGSSRAGWRQPRPTAGRHLGEAALRGACRRDERQRAARGSSAGLPIAARLWEPLSDADYNSAQAVELTRPSSRARGEVAGDRAAPRRALPWSIRMLWQASLWFRDGATRLRAYR